MPFTQTLKVIAMSTCALWIGVACFAAETESGFTSLFDGKTLNGWTLAKGAKGYTVKNGAIVCETGCKGNLLTEKEFSDFVLRLEFKLTEAANNGVGLRVPLDGDAAYMGMEIQVLDDSAPKYANIQPWQRHGSIYGVVPAKPGALKKVGQWNQEEIRCVGRRVKVTLNGHVIVDANLNDVTDLDVLQKHPGLLRGRGHIGFLGHNDYVEFRNIRIKEEPAQTRDNVAPEGFTALFNGRDLTGWKGLVADPVKRQKMSPDELKAAQAKANELMRTNWKVEDSTLAYYGKGFDNLSTVKDYGDFELWADWKIEPNADSGIYLRGTPQVQIWDKPEGSGALWNNKTNPNKPLKVTDKPVGQWNQFRILMTGEKVTVYLNNELVVQNVTLENYWERDKPVYPSGPIELQAHASKVYFKNIYVREIPRK